MKGVECRSGMRQKSIVVGVLVALLAAPSSTYAQEMSGLIQAMKKGPAVDINEVQELLDQGADTDVRADDPSLADENGKTPLILACASGRDDVTRLLLDRGAKVNVRMDDGKTALMFASQHGHCAIVHTLLARGADPGIKSKAGETALNFLERSLVKYRNRKNSSNQTATETLKDCSQALHALTLPLNARHQRDDGEI